MAIAHNEIVIGTTPTIIYSFKKIDVSDMVVAYLTIEQGCRSIVLEKNIGSAFIDAENGTISWELTQADTLLFAEGTAKIMLNYRLHDGTRGASREASVSFLKNQKREVI